MWATKRINNKKIEDNQYKRGILPAFHDKQNKVDLPHFPVPLSLLLGEKTPHGLWLPARTKDSITIAWKKQTKTSNNYWRIYTEIKIMGL